MSCSCNSRALVLSHVLGRLLMESLRGIMPVGSAKEECGATGCCSCT